MSLRKGIGFISFKALHDLLGLPKDVEIVGIYSDDFDICHPRHFKIKLEGGNLPIVEEDMQIPYVEFEHNSVIKKTRIITTP